MAERKATLLIQLKDNASKGLGKIKQGFSFLKSHIVAVGAALAAIGGTIYKSIKAWGIQQEAVAKLNTALSNVPGTTAGASERLQELAANLQKVTTFGDETIISMQALLANFGLNEDAIKKLTPRILDLSAATGVDLKMAAMAIGRTLKTETIGTLTRYGIAVDEAEFKSDSLGTVLKALDNQFGGTAKAIAGTPLGAF